jgi:hypothetical protein
MEFDFKVEFENSDINEHLSILLEACQDVEHDNLNYE